MTLLDIFLAMRFLVTFSECERGGILNQGFRVTEMHCYRNMAAGVYIQTLL